MMNLWRWTAAAALVLLLAGPAGADEALVVGLDRYPTLRPEAALSGGVNDARLMATRLERAGFQVTMLTDAQATRDAILGALQAARSRNGPEDRFVFYFAGHGTGGDEAWLLPSDSVEGSFERDLSAAQLHEAVRAVPAGQRTVLLDTCFSKLFSGARGLGTAMRTRNYQKVASRGLAPLDSTATRPDSTAHLSAAGPAGGPQVAATPPRVSVPATPPRDEVVYFVASRRDEAAQEDEFGGEVHGVFSYYLASRLLSNRLVWSDLQAEVGSLVAERTGDTQHPTLTPGFADSLVFGGPPRVAAAPDPPAPSGGGDAWAAFNRDQVDPGRLDLSMRPGRSTVAVGDLLSFTIRTGMDGYLVVAERGVSGNINLLYPRAPDVEAARVSAGEAITIPHAGHAYSPDRPGTERVRALLFGSRDEAAAFLGAFRAAPSDLASFVRAMKGRDLRLVPTARGMGGGTYTADVFFQVLPR